MHVYIEQKLFFRSADEPNAVDSDNANSIPIATSSHALTLVRSNQIRPYASRLFIWPEFSSTILKGHVFQVNGDGHSRFYQKMKTTTRPWKEIHSKWHKSTFLLVHLIVVFVLEQDIGIHYTSCLPHIEFGIFSHVFNTVFIQYARCRRKIYG